jgi:ribonucleoside-diphosphate reductase alpha chain
MTDYQKYIHLSRYSRWIDKEKRRESWEETIDRYVTFWKGRTTGLDVELEEIRNAILNQEVMPSMRALMTAGKALEKDQTAGYNCAYMAVDDPRVFDEAMYCSMCGTGIGFSVERQFVNKLPEVSEEFFPTDTIIKVKDSKIGWATALRELLSLLWMGKIPKWDMADIRPKGARLKTFGGRASGPAPLDALFRFSVSMFQKARGRKLTSLECHDLMCKIADVVVSGGVRRSAMISLSNLSDDRMRDAKSGQWWIDSPQRALANNSAAYTEKPEIGTFMKEWFSLYESKSGERGIFSRDAARKQAAATGRREYEGIDFGTNPCGEIVLRPLEYCNLSEVVVRSDDTEESLMKKVRLATIIGTLQSTLTDFRYIRSKWKKNCEEERLLGVSLTGILDNPLTWENSDNLKALLHSLKLKTIEINTIYAEKLGINPSVAITTVKPSGTVSQLVNSSSGIHPRYARYYIRRVRSDAKDPLGKMMYMQGVPMEPDVTKPNDVYVFSFPTRAPDHCVTRHQIDALGQLELYSTYRQFWCEHNPSITVYVRECEWMKVGAWVYEHFDEVGGVSFLPAIDDDHIYQQPPYEEISEEKYSQLMESYPTSINWASLKEYEQDDSAVTNTRELACSSDKGCEMVDLVSEG